MDLYEPISFPQVATVHGGLGPVESGAYLHTRIPFIYESSGKADGRPVRVQEISSLTVCRVDVALINEVSPDCWRQKPQPLE